MSGSKYLNLFFSYSFISVSFMILSPPLFTQWSLSFYEDQFLFDADQFLCTRITFFLRGSISFYADQFLLRGSLSFFCTWITYLLHSDHSLYISVAHLAAYDECTEALLGRGWGDDQAEPDREDDAERDGGGRQPTGHSQPRVHATQSDQLLQHAQEYRYLHNRAGPETIC